MASHCVQMSLQDVVRPVTRTALWLAGAWTGEQEQEQGHWLQHWEERRAKEKPPGSKSLCQTCKGKARRILSLDD